MMVFNDSMSTVHEGNNTTSGRPYPHPAQEVVLWAVVVLNITLNLLVFAVVPKIKTLRVSTTAGMLSLAVTDFSLGIAGLLSMSYNTYSGYQVQDSHPLCALVSYGISLFTAVSIAMLAYLNIDRLLTFLYPMSYQLSRNKVIIINIFIWVSVIIIQLPNVTLTKGFKYFEYSFVCMPIWTDSVSYMAVRVVVLFIIPIIISIVSFCGSFHLIRTRHRRLSIRPQTVRVHYGQQASNDPDLQWKRDKRTFKVLAIITFGFYIAWFPYAITVGFSRVITGHTLHPVTDFITPQLAASNSFWNPIIYMLTLRPFTTALSQLCRNTLCGKLIITKTGGSVRKPSVSLDTGTSDTNTGDTNVSQEQVVV